MSHRVCEASLRAMANAGTRMSRPGIPKPDTYRHGWHRVVIQSNSRPKRLIQKSISHYFRKTYSQTYSLFRSLGGTRRPGVAAADRRSSDRRDGTRPVYPTGTAGPRYARTVDRGARVRSIGDECRRQGGPLRIPGHGSPGCARRLAAGRRDYPARPRPAGPKPSQRRPAGRGRFGFSFAPMTALRWHIACPGAWTIRTIQGGRWLRFTRC